MSDVKELPATKRYPAACDIYRKADSVVLHLAMPAVVKENLDIRIVGDLLIIDGKREDVHPEGEYRIHEIKQGNFYQEYTIDDTIDRNNINATIKNGIVTLTLGIKESEKPRKIKIG